MKNTRQESIPVGYILSACADYMCFNSLNMSALVGGGGAEVNKCEQVSSVGHRTSLAGVSLSSESPCLGWGWLFSEVQCIIDNGPMGPNLWTDRHTLVKTLPSRNFVDRR